jgi:putative ABC transport system substrate-binding protein
VDRREALRGVACVLAGWAGAGRSQERRIPRVVMLLWGAEADARTFVDSFREGLRSAGHQEGKTLLLEVRFNSPEPARIDAAVRAAVAERIDVLVVGGLAAARRAKEATSTIPVVVATSSDLVEAGVVASFNRPGGNVTGVSDQTDEAAVKRLELIRAALPDAKRVALLTNPAFPATPRIEARVGAAATRLGFTIVPMRAGDPAALAAAVESMATSHPDALLVGGDPLFNAGEFIARATALRVPVVHYWPGTLEKGALLSYEADVHDNFRRAAGYVDKILKGAKPAEMAIHRPTRYTLRLNTDAARALAIAVPESFRVRVDKVYP